jgi:hypothetical protein
VRVALPALVVVAALGLLCASASAQNVIIGPGPGPGPGGGGPPIGHDPGRPLGIAIDITGIGFSPTGDLTFRVSAISGVEPSPFRGSPNDRVSGVEPSPFLRVDLTSNIAIDIPIGVTSARGNGRVALESRTPASVLGASPRVTVSGTATLTNSRTGEELDTQSYSVTASN